MMSSQRRERNIFLLLSIVALLFGIGIYCLEGILGQTSGFLFDHLPDGLWAFSLTSLLVFIWFQQPAFLCVWILCALAMMFTFEYLQYKHFLKGTGDIKDALIYVVFSSFPLMIRKRFLIMKNKNVLSLLAIGLFGLFAIASSDEEIDDLFEPTSAGEVGKNEALLIDGVEWMVTRVETLDSINGTFGTVRPVDGSTMFIKVSGKTTNKNKQTDFELGDVYLVDADGAEYGEHEDSLDGLMFEELSRNVPKKWSSFFEIPKSSPKPIKLKISNLQTMGYIVVISN